AHMFAALVHGYVDEWSEDVTWDTWKAFSVALDPATPLTPDSFRACIMAPEKRTVRFGDFGAYFDYINDPQAGFDEGTKTTYAILRATMASTLTDLTTITVGEDQLINVKNFIVGRLADGSVVGIRAIAVET